MGKFTYESNTSITFEDRLLAHLQAVIMAKTRRGESFTFTWKDDMSTGGGRTTVYIHPHVSLIFKYSGGRTPRLNPAWLHALNHTANSGRGLYIVPEPQGEYIPESHGEPMTFKEVPANAPPTASD